MAEEENNGRDFYFDDRGMRHPGQRGTSVYVRLALLEKGQRDQERRHGETKLSLASVHKRVTEATDSNRQALETAKTEIIRVVQETNKTREKAEAERMRICAEHKTDMKTCQNDIKWIKGWVGSAWAAITGGIGLIIHHGAKHQ